MDIKYQIKGKPIMEKTLNLAGTWDELEARLLAISAITAELLNGRKK